VLLKVADPVFVAFAKKQNEPITCKYLRKRNAEEKVGIHVI
jgi:UDP-N-acetylglucosamine pyrophosphorylase